MRVVIAEDSVLLREGLVRVMRDADIEVVAAVGDADGAARRGRATRPDLAIVDIRMPPTHTDEGSGRRRDAAVGGSTDARPGAVTVGRTGARRPPARRWPTRCRLSAQGPRHRHRRARGRGPAGRRRRERHRSGGRRRAHRSATGTRCRWSG